MRDHIAGGIVGLRLRLRWTGARCFRCRARFQALFDALQVRHHTAVQFKQLIALCLCCTGSSFESLSLLVNGKRRCSGRRLRLGFGSSPAFTSQLPLTTQLLGRRAFGPIRSWSWNRSRSWGRSWGRSRSRSRGRGRGRGRSRRRSRSRRVVSLEPRNQHALSSLLWQSQLLALLLELVRPHSCVVRTWFRLGHRLRLRLGLLRFPSFNPRGVAFCIATLGRLAIAEVILRHAQHARCRQLLRAEQEPVAVINSSTLRRGIPCSLRQTKITYSLLLLSAHVGKHLVLAIIPVRVAMVCGHSIICGKLCRCRHAATALGRRLVISTEIILRHTQRARSRQLLLGQRSPFAVINSSTLRRGIPRGLRQT